MKLFTKKLHAFDLMIILYIANLYTRAFKKKHTIVLFVFCFHDRNKLIHVEGGISLFKIKITLLLDKQS